MALYIYMMIEILSLFICISFSVYVGYKMFDRGGFGHSQG